jgi:large subunit ribosomal protein L28
MAYTCDICGRGTLVGFNVSHAHNKTKKRQQPNLRTIKLIHSGTSAMTIRVCADDLKTLKRKGLVLRWKDKPENQKPEKAEVETPSKKLDTTPKKATPKAKKEAAAKKKAAAK